MSRRDTVATILYVLRDGAFIALAISLADGLLVVLDTRNGKDWTGRLTRSELAEAVELLETDRVMRLDEAA